MHSNKAGIAPEQERQQEGFAHRSRLRGSPGAWHSPSPPPCDLLSSNTPRLCGVPTLSALSSKPQGATFSIPPLSPSKQKFSVSKEKKIWSWKNTQLTQTELLGWGLAMLVCFSVPCGLQKIMNSSFFLHKIMIILCLTQACLRP